MLNSLTNKDHQLAIGKLGEDIVKESLKFAVQTDDWYDSQKDGTIGKIKYEVKTQRKNIKHNGFWIHSGQWQKCDSVDALFFVQVPENENDPINLYLMTNHKENYEIINWNGKKVRNYLFTKCMKLDTITDARADQMFEHSDATRTWRPTW
jgi:hypothetical protein